MTADDTTTAVPEACGWDTRRGDGPLGGPCLLAAGHSGAHDHDPGVIVDERGNVTDLRVPLTTTTGEGALTAEEEAELRLFCTRNSHGIPFHTESDGATLIRRLLATLDAARARTGSEPPRFPDSNLQDDDYDPARHAGHEAFIRRGLCHHPSHTARPGGSEDEGLAALRASAERYRALAPVYETIGGGDDHARVAELVVEVDRLRTIEAAAREWMAADTGIDWAHLPSTEAEAEAETRLDEAEAALRSALETPR